MTMATANRPIPVRIAPEHVHVHAGLTPQDRADIERFKRLAPGEILNVVTMALLACRLHMKAIREQAI